MRFKPFNGVHYAEWIILAAFEACAAALLWRSYKVGRIAYAHAFSKAFYVEREKRPRLFSAVMWVYGAMIALAPFILAADFR